jgi:hypothetical protein
MVRVYFRWRVGILCLWGVSALALVVAAALMAVQAMA